MSICMWPVIGRDGMLLPIFLVQELLPVGNNTDDITQRSYWTLKADCTTDDTTKIMAAVYFTAAVFRLKLMF